MNFGVKISNLKFRITNWIDNKTWRLRHLWSYGHIAFKADFGYSGKWMCIRCYRYTQRYEKGELV